MTPIGRAHKALSRAQTDRDESRHLCARNAVRTRRRAKDAARVARRRFDRAAIAAELELDARERVADAPWWPCRCYECETERAAFGEAVEHIDRCAARDPVRALAAVRSAA